MESVPDESVALILTDPPYNAESVPLYGDLARHAARVLMPGGSLVAYAGQHAFIDVLPRVAAHLRYWWVFALRHSGGTALLKGKRVFVAWKR